MKGVGLGFTGTHKPKREKVYRGVDSNLAPSPEGVESKEVLGTECLDRKLMSVIDGSRSSWCNANHNANRSAATDPTIATLLKTP